MQVVTPLEKAQRLSQRLGNTLLLKREDLQVLPACAACQAVHTNCSAAQRWLDTWLPRGTPCHQSLQ